MKRRLAGALLIAIATFKLMLPQTTLAVCPICTVAVAGGLGLSRYLGIDDVVAGVWIGGLIISLTIWTGEWLSKKKWKYTSKLSLKTLYAISLAFYLLITYPPLIKVGVIGHPFNIVLGMDKLVFGSIIGAGAFLLGMFSNIKVKEIKGRQLFNYQKVVFPVVSLLIVSLLLYYFGGYLAKPTY